LCQAGDPPPLDREEGEREHLGEELVHDAVVALALAGVEVHRPRDDLPHLRKRRGGGGGALVLGGGRLSGVLKRLNQWWLRDVPKKTRCRAKSLFARK